MFHVILVEPEIPPNTGNVIRLCANTGVQLHLVEPLGFPLNNAKMKRAGLDYHEFASIKIHKSWANFLEAASPDMTRLFALTTHGQAHFAACHFQAGDFLIFGSETKGLTAAIRESVPASQRIRLPMLPNNRSLNLSNSVAIVVYEAWRQNGFAGSL